MKHPTGCFFIIEKTYNLSYDKRKGLQCLVRGGNMTLEERIEHLEFKMDLLYQGTEFTRFLYDCNITKEQLDALYNVLYDIQDKLDKGEQVSSSTYEMQVLEIVDKTKLDYHFCESFVKLLWEERRFEDVFPALYSDNIKYTKYFK